MATVLESGFRSDLIDAHQSVIAACATPGAWWTPAERLAIAAEVRRALTQPDLPPWQAPSSIEGMISAAHRLPLAAIDAIWRITNHPGTLTAEWYSDIVRGLPAPEYYIELVGLTAPLTSIDRFAAIMDLEPIALSGPEQGLPSGELVEGATVTTHWVPTVPGRGANVRKALTGAHGAADAYQVLGAAQYLDGAALLGDLDWNRGTLDRRQIELVAAKTSLLNECFY